VTRATSHESGLFPGTGSYKRRVLFESIKEMHPTGNRMQGSVFGHRTLARNLHEAFCCQPRREGTCLLKGVKRFCRGILSYV